MMGVELGQKGGPWEGNEVLGTRWEAGTGRVEKGTASSAWPSIF